jgi:hypothetical protein
MRNAWSLPKHSHDETEEQAAGTFSGSRRGAGQTE